MWTVCLRLFEGRPDRSRLVAQILNRVVIGGLLLLIIATWPLWTPQHVFPRVPFFHVLCGLSPGIQWAAVALTMVGLVMAFGAGLSRRVGSVGNYAAILGLAVLIATDQHRLQSWAYEYLLLMLVLVSLPAVESIALSRLFVVSIYFFSGISKLNWSFIESGGGVIGNGLLASVNLDLATVSALQRHLLAGLLPTLELLVALGLSWTRTRKFALAGSLAMHILLLVALGPWGAAQKPGVLIWNAVFIVQNLVLFGMAGERTHKFSDSPELADRSAAPTALAGIGQFARFGVRSLMAFVVLFPLTAPLGLCDVWPAWRVYAEGTERARIYIPEEARLRLSRRLQQFVEPPRFLDERCLVRIDRWSLDVLQAPLYPQNRFRLGIALALAKKCGCNENLLVEIEGPANPWTGKRSSQSMTGSAEIMAELNRDLLNGFPDVLPKSDEVVALTFRAW